MPQRNGAREAGASASNFIRSIIASDVETGRTRVVVTPFPLEPNGFLHLGRAKSIALNYELAKEFGGRCNGALMTRTQKRRGWSTSMRSSVELLEVVGGKAQALCPVDPSHCTSPRCHSSGRCEMAGPGVKCIFARHWFSKSERK